MPVQENDASCPRSTAFEPATTDALRGPGVDWIASPIMAKGEYSPSNGQLTVFEDWVVGTIS